MASPLGEFIIGGMTHYCECVFRDIRGVVLRILFSKAGVRLGSASE